MNSTHIINKKNKHKTVYNSQLEVLYINQNIWKQNNDIDSTEEFYRKLKELDISKANTISLTDSPLTVSTVDSDIVNKLNYRPLRENNILFSPQMDIIRNQILNSVLMRNKIDSNKYNKFKSSLNEENYYMINIKNTMQRLDSRTTIMIRNIPNKYTMTSFLNMVNIDFKGKYDIFYLPLDSKNNCNLGFAFINFIDPMHIIMFNEMYSGKKWSKIKSEKICELVYSKVQGRKELIDHFKKNNVLNLTEEIRPLITTYIIMPKIVLPLKLLDLFYKLYPFSSYIIDRKSFTINSFYHFD
jgi:hypothetical protein